MIGWYPWIKKIVSNLSCIKGKLGVYERHCFSIIKSLLSKLCNRTRKYLFLYFDGSKSLADSQPSIQY